jgi:hypothetical protein
MDMLFQFLGATDLRFEVTHHSRPPLDFISNPPETIGSMST